MYKLNDSSLAIVVLLDYFFALFVSLLKSSLLWYGFLLFSFFSFVLVAYVPKKRRQKFFLSAFVALSLLLPPVSATLSFSIIPAYLLVFLLTVLAFVIFRDMHVVGHVLLADAEWAVVATDGDFFAGIPKGIYAARSKKGIRKGDKVLLEVRPKWGERELRILRKL